MVTFAVQSKILAAKRHTHLCPSLMITKTGSPVLLTSQLNEAYAITDYLCQTVGRRELQFRVGADGLWSVTGPSERAGGQKGKLESETNAEKRVERPRKQDLEAKTLRPMVGTLTEKAPKGKQRLLYDVERECQSRENVTRGGS